METPSRGSASSPDPLNESREDINTQSMPPSSVLQRMTRSQRSTSMYSLDVRNRIQPSRYSSPRKQTFHLDVGSGISPQKIRVTVETEGSNSANSAGNSAAGTPLAKDNVDNTLDRVNRRLFTSATTPSLTPAATTSRRRQRSPSPSKPSAATRPARKKARTAASVDAAAATTTTKVPLRGLSDDEDDATAANQDGLLATPKPKRGRPRRSATPMPAADSKTLPDTPLDAVAPAKAASTTPSRRGRKPRAATPKIEDSSAMDELATIDATPSLLSPVKRTPRAARKANPAAAIKATPKNRVTKRSPKTVSKTASSAKSAPAAKKTSKRGATPSFESDNESVADAHPVKRGRGRPRRQAMAPDEMAAIAEQEHEDVAFVAPATSPSPDPIMSEPVTDALESITKSTDLVTEAIEPVAEATEPVTETVEPTEATDFTHDDVFDEIFFDQYQVQTPARLAAIRAAAAAAVIASPALTSLSSVDLINVQTPRQNEENVSVADSLDIEDDGADFAYGGLDADDYFSDDDAVHEEAAPLGAAASAVLATVESNNEGAEIPKLLHHIENALAEKSLSGVEQSVAPGPTEDELVAVETRRDNVNSEEVRALTEAMPAMSSPSDCKDTFEDTVYSFIWILTFFSQTFHPRVLARPA